MLKDLIPWRKKQSEVKRRDDEDVFGGLHRQVNELFDDFLGEFDNPLTRRFGDAGMANPKFDIAENDDAIEVTAELPGLDEKGVDVTLDHNRLIIKGEKKAESSDKKKDYILNERHYGMFQRVFAMPEGLDEENIKASFKKGVLNIKLPKTEEAKKERRRIEVSS